MRSRVLENIDPSGLPFFVDDLRLVTSATNETLVETCLQWLAAFLGAGSSAEREQLVDRIAQSAVAAPKTVRRVFDVLGFFGLGATHRQSEGDFAQALLDDIREITASVKAEAFSSDDEQRLLRTLSALAAGTPVLKRAASEREVKRGVLPMFVGIDATIELRSTQSVFREVEDENEDRLRNLTPIASIRLTFDSGEPAQIWFQTTEADIVELVKKLNTLGAALERLKTDVQLKMTK